MSESLAELIAQAKERACPEANVLPMANESELQGLGNDVREQGLLDPVVLDDGLILDGRNRWVACQLAGVEADVVEWGGQGSRMAYVLSKNLHRRHLDASQKAAAAAEALPFFESEAKERQIATLKQGNELPVQAFLPEREAPRQARDDAAQQFDVSPRYVQEAKRLKEEAPTVFERVKSGELNIPQAKREAGFVPPPRMAPAPVFNPDDFAPEEGEEEVPDPSPSAAPSAPTLAQMFPEGINLPPAHLSREQQASFAIEKFVIFLSLSPDDVGEAAIEIASLNRNPDYPRRHLELLQRIIPWMQGIARRLESEQSGPRLRIVNGK